MTLILGEEKKKNNNNEENRETKDGFPRQIPLLSGFAWRQPRTSVYKLVKKLIWNLNPKKLLRTIFPNEITPLLFLIPLAQIPQGIKAA